LARGGTLENEQTSTLQLQLSNAPVFAPLCRYIYWFCLLRQILLFISECIRKEELKMYGSNNTTVKTSGPGKKPSRSTRFRCFFFQLCRLFRHLPVPVFLSSDQNQLTDAAGFIVHPSMS